jgi:hypothetical protein
MIQDDNEADGVRVVVSAVGVLVVVVVDPDRVEEILTQ